MKQEGNVHRCQICGSTAFDSPARLQTHLIEHSFDDDWSEGGGAGGAERRGLAGEMRCYVCDRAFLQASAIQVRACFKDIWVLH